MTYHEETRDKRREQRRERRATCDVRTRLPERDDDMPLRNFDVGFVAHETYETCRPDDLEVIFLGP